MKFTITVWTCALCGREERVEGADEAPPADWSTMGFCYSSGDVWLPCTINEGTATTSVNEPVCGTCRNACWSALFRAMQALQPKASDAEISP